MPLLNFKRQFVSPIARGTKCHTAIADGFDKFSEMMSFWDGRLPFKGQIIHWR